MKNILIKQIQHILNLVDNLGYNFIPTKSLHCTLLGLSSPSSLWNKYYENLLIENVKEFFEVYKSEINFEWWVN